MTGNYHNLATFFNHLSNFARLFTIQDFSIKAIRNQSDTNTITAATTAKTYIFQEPPPEDAAVQTPARK
jgi:Tfp pilus assembly protein PilO